MILSTLESRYRKKVGVWGAKRKRSDKIKANLGVFGAQGRQPVVRAE